MMRKAIAGVALTGALALGSVGVASAATTTPATPGTHTFNCARAPKVLARIARFEAKAASRLTVLQAREAKAQAAGKTTAEQRIDLHITRVQDIQPKLTARQQKVESACPGAVAAPATTQS